MKKILLILLLFLIPLNVNAFSTSGECTILMDQNSGRILYAKDIHKVRSVASISKIMTAVIAVESGKLDKVVTVDEDVLKAYGSAIYIKPGEEIKLLDLVYGLMLRSGNDAALVIAKYVGGSVDSFVNLMNIKAREIGMKNTTFNNPSGLDNEKANYSTAYDMAILTTYAMKNDIYKQITKTKEHKVKTNMNFYEWHNKNRLLNTYKYTTGGKTGFTEIAKRTLVTTASKDGLDLVVVTLNNGNDFKNHQDLYEEAFELYKNYDILKKGEINILNETFYKNKTFYIKNDFKYMLSNFETETIYLYFEITKKRIYKDDDAIGKVNVIVGDEVVHTEDVYIKSKKEKVKFNIWNWFKRL